jgi:prepilin-type N-terminal cleavage/methylation domain-containing protein
MASLRLKSAQGFGIIEIIVAVVVIGMLAGGVYIYLQGKTETSDSGLTKQEQKALEAGCKVEIDDELLCKAFTAWGAHSAESYIATTTTSSDEGENVMVLKSKGENYHSSMEFNGQTMESIKVGDDVYMKLDGQWYRQDPAEPAADSLTGPESDNPTKEVDDIFAEEKVSKTEYKKLGNEKCGGVDCVKYEIYDKDDSQSKQYLWIDPKKARVMRLQSTSADGGSYDMVYEYTSVTITAPANAKSMSEYMMGI